MWGIEETLSPFARCEMVNINGIDWGLEFVNPNDDKLIRSDNVYTLGATDLNKRRIYISSNLNGALLDKVLCHELVHCFCFSYQYALDMETEEIVADFLATYGREVFDIADMILDMMRVRA